MITMCHILGHGASIHAEMNATMTESYGPEKTGGFSQGDLVLSDDPIDYPNVRNPDVVVTFSQDAFEHDADSVADGGLLVIEEDLVDPGSYREERPDVTLTSLPAVELAEEIGRRVVANVLMLGTVVEIVRTPPVDAVRDAIRETVPDGTVETNERAFERGRTAVENDEIQHSAEELQEAIS